MTKVENNEITNLPESKSLLYLDLPKSRLDDQDNMLSSWMNLLIDSLFKAFGPNLLTASWLDGSKQIQLQSVDYFDSKMLNTPVDIFRNVLLEKQEIDSNHHLDIIFNGSKLIKLKKSKKDKNNLAHVAISLSHGKKKFGYLGIFSPPENGKWNGTSSLLKSPTEITTVLKFLWNMVTQERDRLEAILNGMIDGVLLLNEKGDILFVNQKARNFLGLGSQPFLKIQNLQQAEFLDITTYLEETIENRYESLNKIKKVQALNKILGINIQKLHDASHPILGWMAILRDVTADWEMDRLRKEFIAKITHELHSPLTVISEGIALVLEGKTGQVNNDQKRCLAFAKDNVNRMDRLIDNLLRITKLEVTDQELERRKTVCLRRVLLKLLDSYEHRLQEKQIQLTKVLSESTVPIRMNRDQITQVFINLLENALKYIGEGGAIEVGLKQEFDKITCWVEDNGIGIPLENQEKIFEKFYRIDNETNQSVRGHGLGLAIVKEIITNYGGKIWIESELGKGSRFIFYLPIKTEEEGENTD